MKTLKTLAILLTALGTFEVLPNVALACPADNPACNEQPEPAIELA